MFDGAAFGAEIVEAVKAYVAKVTAPLEAKVEALELELAFVRRYPDHAEIAGLITEALDVRLASAPVARDGVDGKDGLDGVAGLDGADGADAPAITDEQLALAVAAYLAANPPAAGADGANGFDGKAGVDGLPGRDGADGKDGRPGIDGKDGAGLVGVLLDQDDRLVFTMSNGDIRQLGGVCGRDGVDGKDGRDGVDGKDGADSAAPDEIKAARNPDTGMIDFHFAFGDLVYVASVEGDEGLRYRGVFKEGEAYRRGHTATWSGGLWHCDVATTEKPGEASKCWTLAAKAGRPGKDGAQGPEGRPGKDGTPGRDGRGWN